MISIKPFKGLRPRKDIVDKVAAKPYDVLNSQEAKEEAKENPYSFLRISKPEIVFMPDSFVENETQAKLSDLMKTVLGTNKLSFNQAVDQYAEEVYAKGKEVFDTFVKEGILIRDEKPCLYIYAQTMDGRTQTGLVAGSSIDDYFNGSIKISHGTATKYGMRMLSVKIHAVDYSRCRTSTYGDVRCLNGPNGESGRGIQTRHLCLRKLRLRTNKGALRPRASTRVA